MKTNNNKGFTLIELIMVIVILGILAAVAVPKFFSLTSEAHAKNKQSVIGSIKSGLNTYAAKQLVDSGKRGFPDPDGMTNFSDILDEEPEGWTVVAGAATGNDSILFVYQAGTGDADIYTYKYTTVGDSTKYTIVDE